MRIAMKDQQVEHQHHDDEHAERQPMPDGWFAGGDFERRKLPQQLSCEPALAENL